MSLFKLIGKHTKVIERSVRSHASTIDCDAEGAVLNRGGNRTLCSAVSMENALVVFAETNADSVLLTRFNALDFASLIGDNQDARQGIARLRELAAELSDEDDTAVMCLEECIAIAEADLQA